MTDMRRDRPAAEQRIDAALTFTGHCSPPVRCSPRGTAGLTTGCSGFRDSRVIISRMSISIATGIACYFTEVADALAKAKLEFATTAEPLDVVDTINLTAEGIAFLATIEHPILREQARDYFVNQQFRKDLWLRGVRRLVRGRAA